MEHLSTSPDSLTVSGQGAGNTTADNAMTAPGGEPVAAYENEHPAPAADVTDYRQNASDVTHIDRADRWAGHSWSDAGDDSGRWTTARRS